MKYRRVAAACAAAALTVLTATGAYADDFDNDLDLGVDSAHETMSLQYDDLDGIAGAAGSTTVSLLVEDRPDFPNCNITGNHSVTLVPDYDETVVSVAMDDAVLSDCDDTVLVTVTPVHSGATAVTFTGIEDVANAPAISFDYVGADFAVTVTNTDLGEGNPGGGTVCDEDPAAPAWAAALLKGNGVKAKGTTFANYVSAVAHEMGNGATFAGYAKSQHPSYEDAVHEFMTTELGLTLPKGPAGVARPGWECTQVPGTAATS